MFCLELHEIICMFDIKREKPNYWFETKQKK